MSTNMVNILIVEDDKLLSRVYKTNFEVMGFSVDFAGDGQQAWEKIQQGGYAAIVLDVRLPILSGLQILSLMKNEKITDKNGPVIMLSNIEDENAVSQAKELGASAYLYKDKVSPQQVVEEVMKRLN